MAGTKFWVWLHECEIPSQAKYLLLARFSTPEGIYFADKTEYELIDGLTPKQIDLLSDKSMERVDRILGDCQRLGFRIITMQDADYPTRLRGIYDPPFLLYCRGNLPVVDEEVTVAMVGTRKATPYGLGAAEKIGYSLAKQGAVIVSGAARGIDTAALRGALRAGGRTIGVLGCGIDVIYPEENRCVYDDIAASGALLSEYPPGTAALSTHFPVRNRIISGLSLAALVVEAPERSGALITANTALEQGRDVFAVPGPIDAPMSRGCNRLIADGAGLVAESGDILRLYSAQYPNKILSSDSVPLPHALGDRVTQARPQEQQPTEEKAEEMQKKEVLDLSGNLGLTDDQMDVLRALGAGGTHVDELVERTQLPTRRVLSAVTMLQLSGYVAELGGKCFALTVEIQS